MNDNAPSAPISARPLGALLLALTTTLVGCVPAVQPVTPKAPSAALMARADEAVALVQRLGWGTPQEFVVARDWLQPLWPELDWETNGCSTPQGWDLGYRDLFAPACVVHDFAYHNLRVLEPTAENRLRSDEAFRNNLRAICAEQSSWNQPACYAAAELYYAAVRLRGSLRFAAGT